MSRLFRIVHRWPKVVLLCVGIVFSAVAWSQQPASYTRSTAIDQANSRAEHEAEQMVSLSADRILFILRQEPGLLLQVKKALVRKAFEQGRILDPNDLTDDALFDLIRQDDNIRVIATHEIVDRSYIKAKPTREELARNLPCRQPVPTGAEALAAKQPDQPSSSTANTKRTPSQEDQYWLKHEDDLDCYSDPISSVRYCTLLGWTRTVQPDTLATTEPVVAVSRPATISSTTVSPATISTIAGSGAGAFHRLPPSTSDDANAAVPRLLWYGHRPKRDGQHPAR